MKLITALLTLLAVSSISIAQAENVGNTENDQRVYNQAIYAMLQELNTSQDKAKNALEVNDIDTYTRYQCRLLNNLEDIIQYSGSHLHLNGAYSTKTTFEDRLRQEQAPMQATNITKEDICNAAAGLPEAIDMLPKSK